MGAVIGFKVGSFTPISSGAGTLLPNYRSTHLMINLAHLVESWTGYVQGLKDEGINVIWAHLDGYRYSTYDADLINLLNACQTVGGIYVMPGYSCYSWQVVKEIFMDSWDHPALFKIGGKRCYAGWDYLPYKSDPNAGDYDEIALRNYLASVGKSEYYFFVDTRIPYTYENTDSNGNLIYVGEITAPNGIKMSQGIKQYVNQPGFRIKAGHLYEIWPFIDGLINFAVDMDKDSAVNLNAHFKEVAPPGKFTWAGVSVIYTPEGNQARFFGFSGLIEIWQGQFAKPVSQRAEGMVDITANDQNEQSPMNKSIRTPVNGLYYVPARNTGYNYGAAIRYPLLDHAGIAAFQKPFSDAYRRGLSVPEITQDAMFALYALHPINTPYIANLPAELQNDTNIMNDPGLSGQAYWNASRYSHDTGQILNIKNNLAVEYEKIYMGAHLTAPAQLSINGTLSAVLPVGVVHFSLNRGSFRGKPTFAIVRNGVTVQSGQGQQAITDSCYPGGWAFLSHQV